MKELITDIKLIIKKDRQVLFVMIALAFISVVPIILGIINIHSSSLPVWYRYFSLPPYYDRNRWYYFISFILEAIILGGLHNILAVRLYKKQGKVPALIFLAISIFLAILLITVMISIFAINKETKVWI